MNILIIILLSCFFAVSSKAETIIHVISSSEEIEEDLTPLTNPGEGDILDAILKDLFDRPTQNNSEVDDLTLTPPSFRSLVEVEQTTREPFLSSMGQVLKIMENSLMRIVGSLDGSQDANETNQKELRVDLVSRQRGKNGRWSTTELLAFMRFP